MAPRKKSLLGASNPVVQDPGFLPALSSNLAALGPMGGNGGGVPASPVPTVPPAMSFAPTPTPIATPSAPLANTVSLVNKTGTQSLYQRCSYALGRLLRIEGIASFFTLSNSGRAPPRLGLPQDDEAQKGPRDSTVRARQSTDPVRQLWDLLALGVPLCILYNALPGVDPLQIDCSIEETERKLAQASAESKTPTNKHAKHATAFFIMGLKQLAESGDLRGQPEMFTVSELFGNNTNGFVKVVSTVIFLLERLPESIFSPAPPVPPALYPNSALPYPPHPASSHPTRSIPLPHPSTLPPTASPFPPPPHPYQTTIMHEYARELIQKNVVDADTVHHLFPGLGKLLDFGRRFLIEMEGTAQCPWEDQRWGLLFIDNEEEFAVYEPYCANYTNASELMLSQEQNLMNRSNRADPRHQFSTPFPPGTGWGMFPSAPNVIVVLGFQRRMGWSRSLDPLLHLVATVLRFFLHSRDLAIVNTPHLFLLVAITPTQHSLWFHSLRSFTFTRTILLLFSQTFDYLTSRWSLRGPTFAFLERVALGNGPHGLSWFFRDGSKVGFTVGDGIQNRGASDAEVGTGNMKLRFGLGLGRLPSSR
ncbi:Rho guanine nucleotide exchange factor scd1 [Rhizoctonia solani]|uniref:Rho guanine nucleotide exchange factor scd1 n=1 Tax=Rhizoctonia solani TaxID=456999 RepID=A0A8H8P4H3_9AGAM|nr:Rho guanine nucleotide exchange factor scd1 [Rhizoctonia solani]QRW24995.1 Rho guanine nucleotide exchange factor scd1 [Rhizoctonia solani]